MTVFREFLSSVQHLVIWWITVAPWEQALRVRLGKHVAQLGAGVHLRIPFVDRVYRQSVRQRTADLRTQTLTTTDGATVTLAGQVGYAIRDIRRLYETLHHAESTILDLVEAVIARTVAETERAACTPTIVEAAAADGVDLERFGLGDVSITITTFAFVRTFRLIQDTRWSMTGGDSLDTSQHEGQT